MSRKDKKIEDRSTSRDQIEQVTLILQSLRVRTEDLRTLTISGVRERGIPGLCDVLIAELSAKQRGMKTFKPRQLRVVKEFIQTIDARQAKQRREETLTELPQKKAS